MPGHVHVRALVTFIDELEGPPEAGVVSLEVVGVELEDGVGGGGVVGALDQGQVTTQLVVPAALLVDAWSVQVQEQAQVIRATEWNSICMVK